MVLKRIATTVRRPGLSLCLVALSVLAVTTVHADEPPPPSQLSAELGWGYESQTAPLIRLSPQGEFISIDGLQRLHGAHASVGLQGFTNWTFGNAWNVSIAANALAKRSPGNPDFDFTMASFQPAFHLPFGAANLGWGLSLQQITVAGRPFRETFGTQVDWTLPHPEGSHWAFVADLGTYKHPGELIDLDASSSSMMLQRHWEKPHPALQSVDVAIHLAREQNANGFEELSHRSTMVSASMQWNWGETNWSAGANWRTTRFDAQVFPEDPMRADQSVGLDVSVERALTARQTVRLEYSFVRSQSTIPMFDNQYQQVAIKLRTEW